MRYIYRFTQFLYGLGLIKTGSYLARILKNCLGVYNTFIRGRTEPYNEAWWDDTFYKGAISDSGTINKAMDKYSTCYHYASIELLISRALFVNSENLQMRHVLDIGSGAGHWIRFYDGLGAAKICGVDVSKKSVDYLTATFDANESIQVKHGQAHLVIDAFQTRFDIVNAIGVLFHVVDDALWEETLSKIAANLKPGGYLVVGGYFGLLNGLNVQADAQGVNKRLRSRFVWHRALKALGFERIQIIHNSAAYEIPKILPESNLLIARKAEVQQ